jgi:E3 ubiquitin-protein ligase HUWE1
VLQAFKNHGGLEAIEQILNIFYLEVENFPFEKETETSQDNALLTSAFGGIKVILTLFSKLVTAKTIVEATQSTSIASRVDRDKDKSDYFSPSQFLVELRYATFDVIQAIWESNFVERASSSLNKNLIYILKTILEGDQENGAFRKFEKIIPKPKPLPKPWKIPQDSLSRLVNEESVEKGLAKEALYRCCSNFTLALEYCQARDLQPRLTRNPIPDQEQFKRSSRPHINPGESTSRSESNQQRATSADPSSSQTPPTAGGQSSEGAQPSNTQEVATAAAGDGVYMGHPGVNIPSNEDLANEELLTMSIDSPSQNLGMPMTPTRPPPQENATVAGSGGNTPPVSTVDPSSISTSAQQAQADTSDRKEAVTLDDLNQARDSIRETLIERSLNVLNVHADVTFELSDLIMSAVARVNDSSAMRQDIGETIVQSLLSLQMEDDFRPAGKKIASYAHLLGLVLQDQDFYQATLPELKENFRGLLGFVKKFPGPQEEGSPWIAQILLVTEKLLAEDAQPLQVHWSPPVDDDDPCREPQAQVSDPVVSQINKQRLFDLIIDILPHLGKDEALALSIARTLVLLTRNREIATHLSERKNLQRLFVMVKQLAGLLTEKLQGSLMIILRHIIEDEETLKQVMRSEIRSFFHMRHDFEMRQGNRPPDTSAYLRGMSSSILRAPEIFVEVTNEMVKLVRFDPNMRHQSVALKEDDKPIPAAEDADASGREGDASTPQPDSSNIIEVKPSTEKDTQSHTAMEKQKSAESKFPTVEKPDGVIHYLLCELLGYKEVTDQVQPAFNPATRPSSPGEALAAEIDVPMPNGDDTSSSVAASPSPSTNEPKASEKQNFKADQHPIYVYRCFILQCLTELLSCYNRSKIEFINFSRKNPPNQITTPSKPRSSVLSYLLHDLIPVGSLDHSDDIDTRKRLETSAWAISTIVSLCAKTGEKGYDKTLLSSDTEEEPDLLFIRKFVLETALRAYKEASSSSEALGMKYSRMLNISDLFDKLLTTKPNNNASHSALDMLFSSQKQLAKIMFEKGFIAALTCSVADIDLNFPGAKRAVKYILRPLKSLTDTALEIGSSSSAPVTPGQADTDEISSASSASDDVDDREETPDLFRNSTLGMFDPNHDSPSSSESEDGKYCNHTHLTNANYNQMKICTMTKRSMATRWNTMKSSHLVKPVMS